MFEYNFLKSEKVPRFCYYSLSFLISVMKIFKWSYGIIVLYFLKKIHMTKEKVFKFQLKVYRYHSGWQWGKPHTKASNFYQGSLGTTCSWSGDCVQLDRYKPYNFTGSELVSKQINIWSTIIFWLSDIFTPSTLEKEILAEKTLQIFMLHCESFNAADVIYRLELKRDFKSPN